MDPKDKDVIGSVHSEHTTDLRGTHSKSIQQTPFFGEQQDDLNGNFGYGGWHTAYPHPRAAASNVNDQYGQLHPFQQSGGWYGSQETGDAGHYVPFFNQEPQPTDVHPTLPTPYAPMTVYGAQPFQYAPNEAERSELSIHPPGMSLMGTGLQQTFDRAAEASATHDCTVPRATSPTQGALKVSGQKSLIDQTDRLKYIKSFQDTIPEQQSSVLPPLGMARDLKQADDWSQRYGMAMNGLVPVPSQVVDAAGNILPASNNGVANPYTAIKSIFRKRWRGDGAHPSYKTQDPATRTRRSTLPGANIQVAFPMHRESEVMRVLGVGPYHGYCVPVCDLEQLARYHSLDTEANVYNGLTSKVKDYFNTYYTAIGQDYLPSYYACAGDVGRKPQKPTGKNKWGETTGNTQSVNLYEEWKKWKELNGEDNARAAAKAVQRLNARGFVIKSWVHKTNFEEAKAAIEDGTLKWQDWSHGQGVDTHWVAHAGNYHEYYHARVISQHRSLMQPGQSNDAALQQPPYIRSLEPGGNMFAAQSEHGRSDQQSTNLRPQNPPHGTARRANRG